MIKQNIVLFQASQTYCCPKCQQVYADMDTLQTHVLTCINWSLHGLDWLVTVKLCIYNVCSESVLLLDKQCIIMMMINIILAKH